MELRYLARGSTPGLEEVLSDREKRVQLIQEMKKTNPFVESNILLSAAPLITSLFLKAYRKEWGG